MNSSNNVTVQSRVSDASCSSDYREIVWVCSKRRHQLLQRSNLVTSSSCTAAACSHVRVSDWYYSQDTSICMCNHRSSKRTEMACNHCEVKSRRRSNQLLSLPCILENRRVNGALRNCDFCVSDVTELDLPAGSFDVVFSNWLLMYLGDAEVLQLARNALSWVSDEHLPMSYHKEPH